MLLRIRMQNNLLENNPEKILDFILLRTDCRCPDSLLGHKEDSDRFRFRDLFSAAIVYFQDEVVVPFLPMSFSGNPVCNSFRTSSLHICGCPFPSGIADWLYIFPEQYPDFPVIHESCG